MAMEQTETGDQADGETLRSKATELTQEAKQRGMEQLDTTKKAAAEQTQKVAGVIEQASAELERHDQQSLARYAGDFANTIKGLGDKLNKRSIDELGTEALTLARRNPTLFLLGSVGIGFALSRFIKASPARHEKAATGETRGAVEADGNSEPASLPGRTSDATRYPDVVVPNQIKGEG